MPATHDTSSERASEERADVIDQLTGTKKQMTAAKNASSTTPPPPSTHDGNGDNDNDALRTVLKQFTTILVQNDTNGYLDAREDEEGSEITMAAIQTKLDAYTTVKEFKHDLKRVFQSALAKLSGPPRESLEKLYQFAVSTLRFESQRLDHPEAQDDDEQDALAEEQVALFRPTLDGFIFSDAVPASVFHANKEKLPLGIQEMVVHPSSSAIPGQVPNLKSTVPPPPRYPSRIHRHEDKPTVPIQWLDYGAFSSFAPTRDSNHANVSYESTYMGRAAKRFRRWEKKQRNLQTLGKPTSPPSSSKQNGVVSPPPLSQPKDTADTTTTPAAATSDKADEIDTEWLQNQGLDADAIIAAAQSGTLNVDDLVNGDASDIDGQLERNAELLDFLSQYQEHRFGLGDARWASIDEGEHEIANALQKRMQKLISRVAPKDLVDASAIESAMTRLPLGEATYRGTLPVNKAFAYPTTDKVEPIPPVANAIPGYPKERWRVFDLPPAPSKPAANGGGLSSRASNSNSHPPPPPQPHPSASSSPAPATPAAGYPIHNGAVSQSPDPR